MCIRTGHSAFFTKLFNSVLWGYIIVGTYMKSTYCKRFIKKCRRKNETTSWSAVLIYDYVFSCCLYTHLSVYFRVDVLHLPLRVNEEQKIPPREVHFHKSLYDGRLVPRVNTPICDGYRWKIDRRWRQIFEIFTGAPRYASNTMSRYKMSYFSPNVRGNLQTAFQLAYCFDLGLYERIVFAFNVHLLFVYYFPARCICIKNSGFGSVGPRRCTYFSLSFSVAYNMTKLGEKFRSGTYSFC